MGKKGDSVKESPQEKALAEVAMARFQDYKQRWQPLQRQLAEQIRVSWAPDSAERTRAKGQASTESAAQFQEARTGMETALTNSGATPGSSKFNLAMTGLGEDEAASRGLGFTAADQAVDNAYVQGLSAITALGRGEASTASNAMAHQARQGAVQARADAEMSAERRAGWAGLVGRGAGLGIGAAMGGGGSENVPAPNIPTADAGNTPNLVNPAMRRAFA